MLGENANKKKKDIASRLQQKLKKNPMMKKWFYVHEKNANARNEEEAFKGPN